MPAASQLHVRLGRPRDHINGQRAIDNFAVTRVAIDTRHRSRINTGRDELVDAT